MLAHRVVEGDGSRGRCHRGRLGYGHGAELERVRRNEVALGEERHALDDVAELADIARPRVCLQARFGIRRKALGRQAVVGAGAPEEAPSKSKDIRVALPQRRQP